MTDAFSGRARAVQQAEVFREWNTTDLASYLIEITAEVLEQEDEVTGNPLVDVVVDSAGQKARAGGLRSPGWRSAPR